MPVRGMERAAIASQEWAAALKRSHLSDPFRLNDALKTSRPYNLRINTEKL
jgi:hypothetical protein